jgi:DNA-binding NtrC family response regulator
MSEKIKVLVVDDEEIVRRSYVRTLADDDCKVEVAWNGTQALQAVERHPVDVVLLDLRMPGMDGMAVLKAIKAQWPEIEVVVITGNPSVDSAKAAIAMGAYDYLAKPVDPDDIRHATQCAMKHKQWALRDEAPERNAAIH